MHESAELRKYVCYLKFQVSEATPHFMGAFPSLRSLG